MSTILIVDDEMSITDMLCDLLEEEGYNVITAPDGVAALTHLRATRPDLILSDVMMPRLDGLTLYNLVGQNPDWKTIPFVFMSAGLRPPRAARQSDFLAKPFAIEDLIALVHRHLGASA